VPGDFLNDRVNFIVQIIERHLFIERNCCGSTAHKLQAVVEGFSVFYMADSHGNRSHKDQDNGNGEENLFPSNEVKRLSLLLASIELLVSDADGKQRVHNQTGYHQSG